MYNIGIVGRGFVGSAVEFGFSPNVGCDAEVRVYDKDKTDIPLVEQMLKFWQFKEKVNEF